MSTRPELRHRHRHRHRLRREEDGFSLVEVIVALGLLAVVAVAMLPLILTGLKATVKTKIETEAKNLAQLRIERMRALAFHVDEQNGDFVDLLDLYYTDACTTAVSYPDGSTGKWVADASTTGLPGAPTGPAYMVTDVDVDGLPDFDQVVFTQFLRTTHTVAAVASGCTSTAYNSQAPGRDKPPAQLVSVTVLTSWDRGGNAGTLRTYTEIADDRGDVPLVTSQAQALALRVSATTDDATPQTFLGQLAQIKADGSLTTGSVAGMQAEAARAEVLGSTALLGATYSTSAPTTGTPANPAGITGTSASLNEQQTGTADCGWASFGKTQVTEGTATTGAGLPAVPATAGSDATVSTAAMARAGLRSSGDGCDGHAFGWRNYLDVDPTYPLTFRVRNDRPLVLIKAVSGSGSLTDGPAVSAATVTATDELASPAHVSAKARARTATVHLIPTLDRPEGLVTARLISSEIACKSGSAAAASYSVGLTWPGQSTEKVFSLSSAATLPSPSSITFTEGGELRSLSDYLSWGLATEVKQGVNGTRSFGPVFTLGGKAAAVGRDFSLALGILSCAADDNR